MGAVDRARPRFSPLLLAGLLAVSGTGAVRAGGSDGAALAQANQRWAGARCRIRIPVDIKKGKHDGGWSRSGYLAVPGVENQLFYFRLWVSDRDAMRGMLSGKTLPAGALFEAKGWTLQRPERDAGLTLELRFADAPVDARIEFIARGNFGGGDFPLDRLPEVERYMRLEAFRLAPADERLVDVATPPSPTPSAVSPASPPVESPSSPAFEPEVVVLAASVQPPQPRAGAAIDLIMTYSVGGIPAGTVFVVEEAREIHHAKRQLSLLESSQERGAGTHTSVQTVQIPADLAPGLYTLVAKVRLAGLESSAEAIFQVVLP